MQSIHLNTMGLVVLAAISQSLAFADPPPMAEVVRQEVARSQQDPAGRPLPLVAHWHRQTLPLETQIQMISDGVPLLPWINYSRHFTLEHFASLHEGIEVLKDWQMPFALLSGSQWERDFYAHHEWESRPLEETGRAMNADGTSRRKVSPFSPVAPWAELGGDWTDNVLIQAITAEYPNPPKVFFISNNEASKLSVNDQSDPRFIAAYGEETTMAQRREIWQDRWIERYSALISGMRSGLPNQAWKDKAQFVGYNAFGSDLWGEVNGLGFDDRPGWQWHAWEGAIPEAYDNHWEGHKRAFFLWSMQTEMMNLVFMKDKAFAANPEFWFEIVFWDGDTWRKDNFKSDLYAEQDVDYTPELYKGWVQYVMWITVPRVAREWRSSTDDKSNWWPYFETLIDSVKAVHENSVLKRFWRNGELVPNTTMPIQAAKPLGTLVQGDDRHPFRQALPDEWPDIPRWYHLNTNLDPDLSMLKKYREHWKDEPLFFPVWALARRLGDAPAREWLVYAHAPMGPRESVTVEIPDYQEVTLPSISIAGTFFYIKEQEGTVVEIDPGAPIAAPGNLRRVDEAK